MLTDLPHATISMAGRENPTMKPKAHGATHERYEV